MKQYENQSLINEIRAKIKNIIFKRVMEDVYKNKTSSKLNILKNVHKSIFNIISSLKNIMYMTGVFIYGNFINLNIYIYKHIISIKSYLYLKISLIINYIQKIINSDIILNIIWYSYWIICLIISIIIILIIMYLVIKSLILFVKVIKNLNNLKKELFESLEKHIDIKEIEETKVKELINKSPEKKLESYARNSLIKKYEK